MGGFNKYLFRVFFSFNALASVDYIYLRAWGVRPGVGGLKGNLIFIVRGAVGAFKTNLNKKVGGSRQIILFFSITSVRITFSSNRRVGQERGMIQAIKKNSGRVGTLGVLTNIYFKGLFFI